jgi:hypothetical protein
MEPSELLKQLGLSPDDLNNLLLKFRVFYGSLTESEAKVVNRLLPTFQHAAALFGGKIDRDDLRRLLLVPPSPASPPPSRGGGGAQAPAGGGGPFGQSGINQIPNGGGSGGSPNT